MVRLAAVPVVAGRLVAGYVIARFDLEVVVAAGVKDLAAELMITFRATRLGHLLVQDPKAPNTRLTQHQIGKQTQNRCV